MPLKDLLMENNLLKGADKDDKVLQLDLPGQTDLIHI